MGLFSGVTGEPLIGFYWPLAAVERSLISLKIQF